MSLIQWEDGRQVSLEKWERQDWPWQPGGRRHAGDSFPSRQDHGDEVGEEDWEEGEYVGCEGVGYVEEGGDWDMKRGGESGGHLVDPVCS